MAQPLWFAWMSLGLSATGSCAGNLLLKQTNVALSSPGLLPVIASPWFIGAIACYILDLVFFTQALQHLPVSAAVPVVSGIRIGATAILADVFFGEHFTFSHVLASSLIAAGIVIMSRA